MPEHVVRYSDPKLVTATTRSCILHRLKKPSCYNLAFRIWQAVGILPKGIHTSSRDLNATHHVRESTAEHC